MPIFDPRTRCSVRRTRLTECTFALACLAGISASAQESIRPSSTGAQAAEVRRQVTLPQNYNLKAGPVTFDATGSIEVEFNDNIGLSENNRDSDFIFRPEVRLNSEWRVSTLNTLRFSLGVGYAKYASHSKQDTRSLLFDPGSEISFNVYLGDNVRLEFHDRFAVVQNPVDEPTLSNTARFDRFQNSAGVTAFVDLNDLNLVFGYDHFDYRALGSQFDFLDRREEQFLASASLRFSDAVTAGVDGSFALVNYRQNFNNDGDTWSAGPFVEAAISAFTKVRVSGGYQAMNFDSGGTNGDHSDFGGWYATLAVAQRLNQYWSHSLSFGHEARLGLEVNFAEYTFARYLADWRVNSRLHAGFDAFVEDADESGSAPLDPEHAFRWGTGASLSYRLGSKTSVGLRYRYVNKDSNLALRSYYQNVGILSLNYDF